MEIDEIIIWKRFNRMKCGLVEIIFPSEIDVKAMSQTSARGEKARNQTK